MNHSQSSANRRLADLAAVAMVVASLYLAITSVWNDVPITDEIPHIGAGYSYVAKMDHRLNPEHPPLAKDLAGISLKIYGLNDSPAFESRFWQEEINGQWDFGKKLLFGSGNDAVRASRFAKIPMFIFFIISAVIIFTWTGQMYGWVASLMALFLFAFSPTVLAHTRFVTTDVPALFGVLVSSYLFVHYLKNKNKKNLALAGIGLGIAELTKFSLFLLLPFFLVTAVIYAFLKYPGSRFRSSLYFLLTTGLIIIIGYIFIVWPVYILHTWNYPPELQQSHTKELLKTYGTRWVAEPVIYIADKPLLRGMAEYGLGLLMVTQRSVGGNTTYFMGEVRNWAWPQYFPVVYFIKEPLAFWFMLILVWLICAVRFKFHSIKYWIYKVIHWAKNNFDQFFMIAWIILYWIVSIRSNLNIGVRHLMPVYGFTFILLAGQLNNIIENAKVKVQNDNLKFKILNPIHKFYILIFTLFILFGWYLYENISVYPYYLTYFNQVAGGPSGGYRYVVDSNLDWGQDLKRLSDWVDENDIQKISLDYFGWSDQSYFLKDKLVWIHTGDYANANEFLKDNPDGGYIAVSASFYMGSLEHPETSYAWLNNHKPVTVIGNSIFVWYIQRSR